MTKTKPIRRPGDTRDRLIQAGTELIWEFGYSDVSIDDILARADALKGSFYHFFSSKQDFLIACLEAYWGEMYADLKRAYEEAAGPAEAIDAHMRWFVTAQEKQLQRFGRVFGGFHQSVGAEAYHLPRVAEKFEEQSREYSDLLKSALETMRQAGEIESAQSLHSIIGYCIDGALYRGRLTNSPEPVRGLPELVASLLAASTALTRARRALEI
jgi:TetR/AcrR family transcriptional regulator, transcriptional repressor for nem operon